MIATVVIATYQREAQLARAVASVKAQTVPVETIVVPDETPRDQMRALLLPEVRLALAGRTEKTPDPVVAAS